MATRRNLREHIVDAALALAEETHWEQVRLHDVAARLEIPLEDIRAHFREKEDLTDAWFDRADAAMLARAEAAGFDALPARERIAELIMTWLEALAPHRKATRQMILGKLEFGHIHIQIPGLMRVSRTVQWVREAAGRKAAFARRALEETGLTTIYLMTFVRWMNDDSPGAERTRRFLEQRLACAERLDRAVWRERA
jgi:ubiquinone biosynthesis protein COQ9